MRAGVFISGVSHVVLVALALLGTPKLFDSPQLGAIEVDLVRPEEAELKEKPPEEKPAEKPKDNQPTPFDPFSPQATEVPQAAAKKPEPPPKPPASTQQALGPPVPSPTPTPPPPPSTPWIFDPANIPALMNLPAAPERGFDAEATTTANLSGDEKAVFKAHLKTCWKLPEGMTPAQTTRVVLRVFLRADGRLSADPLLIEASASRDGPLLLKAAIRTLKDCQPYAFLPAEKYREWKVLDLSFSPRDMAGG